MKATTLLKNDHAAVKKLFADFRRTTARAPRRRQELIDKIAQELEPSGGWAQDERDDNGERTGMKTGAATWSAATTPRRARTPVADQRRRRSSAGRSLMCSAYLSGPGQLERK